MKKLLCAAFLSVPLFAQIVPQHPIDTTVTELSRRPQDFDGRLVRIHAVLGFGWEGDNFLVDPAKPIPLSMPSRDPASIWFYCEEGREAEVYKAIGPARRAYGTFEGFFHFLLVTRIINGVFDPGQLQFEAVSATIPANQPHTLAEASFLGDVDETRRILHSDASAHDERYLSILLFEAAHTGRADFIEELVAAGADPKFNSRGVGTSLMAAAWDCKLDAAKALLAHGAQINAANTKGETALMYAAQTCRDGQMVKLLLEAGANPNAKTPDDFTTLMWAAGNPLNAERLLKAGADPTVKNRYGSTAESDNCDRGEAGHAQVCALIRETLRH
jgi:ankyrin repeat protein